MLLIITQHDSSDFTDDQIGEVVGSLITASHGWSLIFRGNNLPYAHQVQNQLRCERLVNIGNAYFDYLGAEKRTYDTNTHQYRLAEILLMEEETGRTISLSGVIFVRLDVDVSGEEEPQYNSTQEILDMCGLERAYVATGSMTKPTNEVLLVGICAFVIPGSRLEFLANPTIKQLSSLQKVVELYKHFTSAENELYYPSNFFESRVLH